MARTTGRKELLPAEAERVREAIQDLARECDDNYAEVGRRLDGTTGQAISQLLGGVTRPSLDLARRLAKYRRVHVAELLWPEYTAKLRASPPDAVEDPYPGRAELRATPRWHRTTEKVRATIGTIQSLQAKDWTFDDWFRLLLSLEQAEAFSGDAGAPNGTVDEYVQVKHTAGRARKR